MKIVHNIPSINKNFGGPIFSTKIIANEQAKSGNEVFVVTSEDSDKSDEVIFDPDIKVIKIKCYTKIKLMFNWSKILMNNVGVPDIIHTYGLWTYNNYAAFNFCKTYNVKHIIAPCGMLCGQAMRSSERLKKIALIMFQKKIIIHSDAIHVKSTFEEKETRLIFPNKLYKIIPNPISIKKKMGEPYNKEKYFKYLKNKKVLLYLGRIDERKGLIDLLLCWNEITKKYKDWTLVIAGDLIQGRSYAFYRKLLDTITFCENLILFDSNAYFEMKDSPNVIFTGSVYGKQKKDLFIKSSVFINPSNFENYGQSIAEALSYNIPVVISKNTPWDKVVEKNCGWLLLDGNKNLKKILEIVLAESQDNLKKMGLNSSKLVSKLNPEIINEKTLEIYNQLQNAKA